MRQLIAVALLIPLLAACGGETYESAFSVAKASECRNFHEDTDADRAMFATESGMCMIDFVEGQRVNWFKDGKGLDMFRKMADEMGGGFVLYGSNWAIECSNRKVCKKAQGAIGGEIG